MDMGPFDRPFDRKAPPARGLDFVVYDTERGGWIASIDTYDGDVDRTRDPMQARIFHGPEWGDFWAPPRYRHYRPA